MKERASGKRPVGYRAPSWQFSFWTMKQVKHAGFLYDSSLHITGHQSRVALLELACRG